MNQQVCGQYLKCLPAMPWDDPYRLKCEERIAVASSIQQFPTLLLFIQVETLGQSRVSSTFSKTSSATLSAITGLSATLAAEKTYAFDISLYTDSTSGGGI